MPRFLSALFALVVGSVLGWFLLAGFCSIPGIEYSTACGHNAYVWLPLFIPLGIAITWFVATRFLRSFATSRSRNKGGSHEKAK
jgi:hypothetical protein